MRTTDLRGLNFRHLHYFWVVAKESHLTRAAERLHVSQSAVSTQLKQLEAALGHDLFERDGRTLKLTEAGGVVLGYAESIFDLGAELLATVRGRDSGTPDVLRVGAVATLSRNFQQNLLKPLLSPDAGRAPVQLILESASLGELLDRLKVHKLDLVLSNRPSAPGADRSMECRRIARQSVCLVGAARRRSVALQLPGSLDGMELIVPGQSSDIRSQFELYCAEHRVTPTIRAEVDDMAMLRLLARDSGTVAVVPEVVVQDEIRSGVLRNYGDLPDVFETFYAITAKRRFQPAVLATVLAPAAKA